MLAICVFASSGGFMFLNIKVTGSSHALSILIRYLQKTPRYVNLFEGISQLQTIFPLDQIGSCLIRLSIAMKHTDCHFKFQNRSLDVKVLGGQSEDLI